MEQSKTQMGELVDFHLNRMEIEDKPRARHNLLNVFMPTVLEMESSGNYQAVNIPQKGKEATSAKGGFQFVAGSVVPALNRLERRLGKQEWGADLRKHKDASKLTPQQQQLIFMADLLEKDGSDKYMKEVMKGDKQGSMDAYYKLHHTAPDEATTKRAEDLFGQVYNADDKEITYRNSMHYKNQTMEQVMMETNQVASDQIGRQLVGFKGLVRTLQLMFGLEPGSNDEQNKGGY